MTNTGRHPVERFVFQVQIFRLITSAYNITFLFRPVPDITLSCNTNHSLNSLLKRLLYYRYTKMLSVTNDGQARHKRGNWDPAEMHKTVKKYWIMRWVHFKSHYVIPALVLSDTTHYITTLYYTKNIDMSIEPAMDRFHNAFSP